jgi:hypothetical protein
MVVNYLAPPHPHELYRRNPDGSFELVTPGVTSPDFSALSAASADASRILFASVEDLTPDSQSLPTGGSNRKLYQWSAGQLSLVSVLPDGTPSLGNAPKAANVISADGGRIYWQSGVIQGPSAPAPIYLSESGSPSKVVSADQSGAAQPGLFLGATPDGSAAFFTSTTGLTADASSAGADLYRYDAAVGELTDLTPDATDVGGAAVKGLTGVSDDGSSVYFVAQGVLASGATAGQNNLYLRHGGATTFITKLEGADSDNWIAVPWRRSTRAQLTGDGEHLLFSSSAQLDPGYDNAGFKEIYLYDAASGAFACVSCDPSGAPATGNADLTPQTIPKGLNGINSNDFSPVNNLSDDAGRVFFQTADSLLPADTNGEYDVYQWEAKGTGSCADAVVHGGCLYLISSGRDSSGSYFENTTASGDDVFILTREGLVGQDADENFDVYDARVGGGFAAQNPAPPPPPCSGDGCQGSPTPPPAEPASGSSDFSGPGNRAGTTRKRCGKHRKFKHGRCVKSHRNHRRAK